MLRTDTCPLVIYHPEGDVKYFFKDQLRAYGNLLSCNYAWKDVKYHNYWGFDYLTWIYYSGKGNQVVLNEENTFATKFLCLNGRPTWHRYYIVQQMYNDQKLYKKGVISLLNRYSRFKDGTVYEIFKRAMAGKGSTSFIDNIVENEIEVRLDKTTEQVSLNDRGHENWLYDNTSVSFVTETYPEAYRGLFITEKSWKPIGNCHFQIWVAQPGIVQAFRDFGYDMFDDIIDHSYDTIMNDFDRFDAAIVSLKKFLKLVKSLDKEKMMARLLANKTKYLNMKIKESDVLNWLS